MPTSQDILDAAFLSNLAYSNNPPPNAGQGWTVLSRADLGLTQSQWDNDSLDGDNSQTLFDNLNAQGIVAVNGNTLSIAFRGTSFITDLVSDLVGGIFSFSSHFNLFSNLITAAENYARNPANHISSVLVAGHSLGGAMVEMYLAATRNSDLNITGVTFGSPGSKDIAPSITVDSRLLNIGHLGDPVFRATFGEIVQGLDVGVDLPSTQDLNSLGALLSFWTLTGSKGEHDLFQERLINRFGSAEFVV